MSDFPFTVDYTPHADGFEAVLQREALSFMPYAAYYEPAGTTETRFNAGLALVPGDAYSDDWLDRYFSLQARGTARLGILTAQDVRVTEEWGLAVGASGFALTGMYGFGWMDAHFDYLVRHGHTVANAGGFALAGRARRLEKLPGTTALLSFPGALTYGHWIVDIAGRMELMNALLDMNSIDRFLLPRVAAWMRPFLVAYGILPARIIELDKDTVYVAETLHIPTTVSHNAGGTLPVRFAQLVFRRLAALCRQWGKRRRAGASKSSRIVYLDHTPLTSSPGRALGNIADVRALIARLGGKVVDPMRLTLAELAAELADAELVVGQDSSALHNIIFAPTDLLVIETVRRQNMLHPSIQEACRKRFAALAADETGAGWQVDMTRLEAMIGTALADAGP